jgi:hypothetical protein
MNCSDGDGGRPPSWAEEQCGCIVGVLLTLAMIGVAVMYFMGWL